VPPGKDEFVFDSYPEADDNALALYIAVCRERELEHCRLTWLVQNPRRARKKVEAATGEPVRRTRFVRKRSPSGILAFLRASHVFTTHGTYWFARSAGRQKIVNLWHGMPLKRICLLDGKPRHKVPFCTHAIATSPYFARMLAAAFGLPIESVKITGLPRNDWLAEPQPWQQMLQVNEAARLAVWMPTYRNSNIGDVRSDGSEVVTDALLQKLDNALRSSDIHLAVKLHPMDRLNERNWPRLGHVSVLTHDNWEKIGLNTYRFLANAYCLITDFSSVTVDFALLRRPIALFAPDLDAYERGFMPGALERFMGAMTVIVSDDALVEFLLAPDLGGRAGSVELNAPGTDTACRNVLSAFDIIGHQAEKKSAA
jgi:CDP-glycerol glycerophosphotransferase (TagB/SpsB family)